MKKKESDARGWERRRGGRGGKLLRGVNGKGELCGGVERQKTGEGTDDKSRGGKLGFLPATITP